VLTGRWDGDRLVRRISAVGFLASWLRVLLVTTSATHCSPSRFPPELIPLKLTACLQRDQPRCYSACDLGGGRSPFSCAGASRNQPTEHATVALGRCDMANRDEQYDHPDQSLKSQKRRLLRQQLASDRYPSCHRSHLGSDEICTTNLVGGNAKIGLAVNIELFLLAQGQGLRLGNYSSFGYKSGSVRMRPRCA
jgi:hypothetical protein